MRIHLRDEVTHWEPIAMSVLHWYDAESGAWLSHDGTDGWAGWDATTLAHATAPSEWRPWTSVVDDTEAPFVRWFVGAKTNAAFNEVRASPASHITSSFHDLPWPSMTFRGLP